MDCLNNSVLKTMAHMTVTPTSGHTILMGSSHHVDLSKAVYQISSVPEIGQYKWIVLTILC